ncbi:unnamed protein product [Spodoptera littoralis]|uniref:Uncharacterized protein n=1 Tax=Spodoptera littoralis TaxID=7109 RepID=A0A9P0NAQ6_SPOLI|nr:unnamed protein product [Spodoptera littoralis]CAH1645986.1 unnamed protein product [Spodoptera littoralis]
MKPLLNRHTCIRSDEAKVVYQSYTVRESPATLGRYRRSGLVQAAAARAQLGERVEVVTSPAFSARALCNYARAAAALLIAISGNAPSKVWSAGGGAGGGGTACGSSGMDLKHEVAYRGVLPGAVKAEPGVSHNGHQANGHVRDWMAGGAGAGAGAGSPSPGPPVQPQPNGYSSPLSSGSYGPYSPNGKIGMHFEVDFPKNVTETNEGKQNEVLTVKENVAFDAAFDNNDACDATTTIINVDNDITPPHYGNIVNSITKKNNPSCIELKIAILVSNTKPQNAVKS